MIKHLSLLSLLLLALADACAATAAEERIASAPMPHELLAASQARTKVHFVALGGYVEGEPDNATRLADLKRDVQRCVANLTRNGAQAMPPARWPEFVQSLRQDQYVAPNRSIVYAHGVGYGMSPKDCSLIEHVSATAELVSAVGVCHIDLLAKTASGECDVRAHAGAPRPPALKPPAQAGQAAIRNMGNDAMALALQRAAAYMPAATGAKKVILGVACEVVQTPAQPGASHCMATGGSFSSMPGQAPGGQNGLILESLTRHAVTMKAVRAALDSDVPAAVFAPYIGAGFTITSGAQQ